MSDRDRASRLSVRAQSVQSKVESWSPAKQDFARRVSDMATVKASNDAQRSVRSTDGKKTR